MKDPAYNCSHPRSDSGSCPDQRIPRALPLFLLTLPIILAVLAWIGHQVASARPIEPPAAAGAWERWYWGGFAGKKVVIWGNSTVSHANLFLTELAAQAASGGELEGLVTAPRVDNTSAAEVRHNGLIHAYGDIVNYGNSGATLRQMLDGGGDIYYRVDDVIAARPDLLIIRGPLINDVRVGTTNRAEATALLAATLDKITVALPHTAILLVTENSLLSTDLGGYHFVQPNSAAQPYTNIMHDAVMAMAGRYPQVKVFDLMAAEYGLQCLPRSTLMHDQLHPSSEGQEQEAKLIARIIGRQSAR
jgi:lysophospholipase L1-like esterase